MRIPDFYNAVTCFMCAQKCLSLARFYATLARCASLRDDSHDARRYINYYKDYMGTAVIYRSAYIARRGAPIVDAPAVNYSVWEW